MAIIKNLNTENMTLDNVHDILGLSPQQISNLVKDKGLPFRIDPEKVGRTKNYYVLEDVLAWYVKYRSGLKDEDLGPLDQARLVKLKIEADREKLKYEREKEALLPARDIEEGWSRTISAANTMRESFGDLASKLIHDGQTEDEKASILQAQVDAIFEKMNEATFIKNVFIEDEDMEESSI
jgi:hypothetical protein